MNKKTFELKEKMLQFEDISDRLEVMKDWYKGETCYIVSAGPSLKDIDIDYLKSNLYDKCITKDQSIMDLYMPPNYHLYSSFFQGHKSSFKFLVDKLKE